MVIRIAIFLVILGSYRLAAQNYSIQFQDQRAVSIRLEAQAFDGIKVVGAKNYILGELKTEGNAFLFIPLLPFNPNQEYEVYSSSTLLFTFTALEDQHIPEILSFYPQSTQVPSNFLKFYIEFDRTMGEVNPYEKINIYRGGELLEHAILKLDPPLWNQDYDILTVWLEPGRIKRGLGPNERRGAILQEGDSIEIRIAPFTASNGLKIEVDYSKKLYITERDSEKPELDNWQVVLPELASRSAITFITSEPMDYLSTLSDLNILQSERLVEGEFQMLSDSALHFVPKEKWSQGVYKLQIKATAEDLAANNFNRLFDQEVKPQSKKRQSDLKSLKFEIKRPE